jgi:protein TonB
MAHIELHISRMTAVGLALPVAAVVTVLLFWVMPFLISTGVPALQQAFKAMPIEFVRAPRDETVQVKERKLPDKPTVEDVVPPPLPVDADMSAATAGGSTPIGIAAPTVSRELNLGRHSFEAPSDTEAVPLVRIPPEYPLGPQARGIEGWVVIQFTIDEVGRVRDPSVVQAEPPGVFDNAAVAALLRWRYKPKVENGRAVKMYDNRVVITFDLPEDQAARAQATSSRPRTW